MMIERISVHVLFLGKFILECHIASFLIKFYVVTVLVSVPFSNSELFLIPFSYSESNFSVFKDFVQSFGAQIHYIVLC